MPLLSSVCVEAPLVTTLKCWSWLAGAFFETGRPCAVPQLRLSSASVTSVGVVPWRRSLRLCCANPMARAISDMAVGPNPDSNPGLSDLRRLANDIRNRTRSHRWIEPRSRKSGNHKISAHSVRTGKISSVGLSKTRCCCDITWPFLLLLPVDLHSGVRDKPVVTRA